MAKMVLHDGEEDVEVNVLGNGGGILVRPDAGGLPEVYIDIDEGNIRAFIFPDDIMPDPVVSCEYPFKEGGE